MARVRSPNRDKAFEIYKEHAGNIANREISKILDISEKTISGWKAKDKWNEKLNGVLQKEIRSTPKEKDKIQDEISNKKAEKNMIVDEVKQVLNNTELTDKQKLFCIYYIKCFNATKAYQKAYGCKYDVANAEGYKLLVNPCVKSEIEKLKRNKLNRAMLSEDDIFQKYIDIAFADITDYLKFGQEEVPVMSAFGPLEVDGKPITKIINVVKFNESVEVDGTIISEVKQGKDGASIKLQDKMKALEFLAKNIKYLDNEIKVKLELENKKLANEKLRAEIAKLNGDSEEVEDLDEIEDDIYGE